MGTLSPEVLAGFAGLVLSVILEYLPWVAPFYEKFTAPEKRAVMGGLILAVGTGAYGLSCGGPFDFLECSTAGAWDLVELVFWTLVVNQGAHSLTKKS
jgi:hypothetical protein